MDKHDELIQQLDEARQKLLAAVAQIPAEHEIYPHWKVKELLAHVTGWDDAAIASIQAVLGGEIPKTPAVRGLDYYNAITVSEREALDMFHVSRECDVTREQFKTLIRQVPEERLDEHFILPWGPTGSVTGLANIFTEHEEEHADDILNILKAEQDAAAQAK
jgi:hypothetical protein